MDRRQFIKKTGQFALAASVLPRNARDQIPQKPNIVLILVDDLGWTDLGCFGDPFCFSR